MQNVGDTTGSQAVKLQVKAAKLTYKVIAEVISEYLEASKKGEMNFKKFKKEYGGKEIIPVSNKDIKGLKKELEKEGIKFSVVKNKDNKDTYDLYFKGQDINQVKQGLERFTQKAMNPTLAKSIRHKLARAVEIAKEKNSQIQQKVKERAERGIDAR